MTKIAVGILSCFVLTLMAINADAQVYFSDDFENAAESGRKWFQVTGRSLMVCIINLLRLIPGRPQ
jgi:hypothetical protein